MNLQFNLVLNGEPSMIEKFHKTIQENPEMHMDLIRAITQSVMLAFRLNKDDNISITSFKAGKLADPAEVAAPVSSEVKDIAN